MNNSYLPSVDMPMLRKIQMPSLIEGNYKTMIHTKLGILNESNLLKKIQKIGNRNHKPTGIIIKFKDELLIRHEFTVNSIYPTKEKVEESLVEFLYDYSMKGNIVACSVIKRFRQTSIKLTVAQTNDYRYSNITADVIDSLIQSVNLEK